LIKKIYSTTHRIVALTHIGYYDDIDLAQNTTGISLIICGHSHTLFEDMARASGSYLTIINNPDGDEVFIVTDYRWGEYLGYIDVEYDPQGKLFMKAPQSILPAQLHYNLISSQKLKNGKKHLTYWRKPSSDLRKLLSSKCEQGQCNLGDSTADGLKAYHPGPAAATGY